MKHKGNAVREGWAPSLVSCLVSVSFPFAVSAFVDKPEGFYGPQNASVLSGGHEGHEACAGIEQSSSLDKDGTSSELFLLIEVPTFL